MPEEGKIPGKRLNDIIITRIETKPVILRNFDCNDVKSATQNIDEILKYILREDLTETNDLIRSTSILLGELIGK